MKRRQFTQALAAGAAVAEAEIAAGRAVAAALSLQEQVRTCSGERALGAPMSFDTLDAVRGRVDALLLDASRVDAVPSSPRI